MGKHIYDILEEKGWELEKRDTILNFVGDLYIKGKLFATIYTTRLYVNNADVGIDTEVLGIIKRLQNERIKQEFTTVMSNYK